VKRGIKLLIRSRLIPPKGALSLCLTNLVTNSHPTNLSLHNLTFDDAIELALDKPPWRLLVASGATHRHGACRIMMMTMILVFWIFLLNVMKIDPYNFELYRFKVCAFFWDTV